jgi:hypothetical protein
MEKTTFDLEANEAALIFKEDLSIEIVLPSVGDDEKVDVDKNQNIFVAIAIAASADNPMFRHVISNKMDEMLNGPQAGCGGCCGCDTKEPEEDDGTDKS